MSSSEPMKVVYINTQYVEIDVLDFKSAVQNLTGKDSVIPSSFPPPAVKPARPSYKKSNGSSRKVNKVTEAPSSSAYHYQPAVMEVAAAGSYNYTSTNKRQISSDQVVMERGNSFLMRDLSFKEIDRLLKELPAFDELHSLFSDQAW